MAKKFNLYKEEDGIATVWFALFFIVIVFISGVAIDGGRLYKTKSELRKAADAAVLSGAQDLTVSSDSVTNIVNQILAAHNETSSLQDLSISPTKVTVTLKKDVPLCFMKIFKIDSAPVSVISAAQILPMKETVGAVPFGISKDIALTYMQEYELKVDSGSSLTGNFGILALAGVGGKLYEDALKYGYDQALTAGQVVDTQTGNVEQKTINGVNYRISESSYATNDISHRDDPRIIKVLVYEPYLITTNQIKSVKIDGFAYFYLEQPMSSTDSTVRGYFIRETGTGTGSSEVVDKGAYAIKLVE